MSTRQKIIFLFLISLFFIFSCQDEPNVGSAYNETLVSKKFIDNDTFKVVCKGFPLQGSEGIVMKESAKRAARLNAYYFIKQEFKDSVKPDADGEVEKIEYKDGHAVIYYLVKKKGLKFLVK